jgi:hypothetical protein
MRINGSTQGPPNGAQSSGAATPRGAAATGLLAPTDGSDPLAALNIGRKSMVGSHFLPICGTLC